MDALVWFAAFVIYYFVVYFSLLLVSAIVVIISTFAFCKILDVLFGTKYMDWFWQHGLNIHRHPCD